VAFGSTPGPDIRGFRDASRVTKPPTTADLGLLSEHLCYEVEMTYCLAAWLGAFPNASLVHNAALEAFTIHVRQLTDFFWPQHPRRGGDSPDAFASDFFEEGEWERLQPERPDVLSDAIRKKIGWGVAHLTYGRAWSKPEDKQWNVAARARALAPAVIALVDNVEPEKLDPDHVKRMKVCAEEWGGRPGGLVTTGVLSGWTG
jgi:hypothetical protein